MAASAPPPNVAAGWVETQKSSSPQEGNTRGLEIGMSGLTLMPAFSGGANNGSNDGETPVEPSPVDEVVTTNLQQDSQNQSGSDSIGGRSSSPGSPSVGGSNAAGQQGGGSSKSLTRPPGLGGSSLIGKPGHSKNSSASTAQSLTLTPASSIDGSAELYHNVTRQSSSPFHGGDGPSTIQYKMNSSNASGDDNNAELPTGITTFGSFDAASTDHDNDGLLGLDALRDRAYSTPGLSSSPPVRGQIAAHGSFHDDVGGVRGTNVEQRRPRAVSKDSGRPAHSSRPPLSGGSTLSPHPDSGSFHGDRSLPGVSIPFSSGSRSRDPSPPPSYSQESAFGGPGVIGARSGYGGFSQDSNDVSLRRASSTDTGRDYQNPYSMYVNSGSSFGGQASNQRMNNLGYQQTEGHVGGHEFHRHQRSLSQPGPARNVASPDYYGGHEDVHRRSSDYGAGVNSQRLPPGMDNDYGSYTSDSRYNQQQHQQPNEVHYAHGRSMSMQHTTMSSGFGSQGQRRSSLQTGSAPGHLHSQTLRRRGSLDFVPGQSRYADSGVPIVASGDEMRMFGGNDNDRIGGNTFNRHERLVSPAHSPLHIPYGTHSRGHSSDMGSSAMSSSPMSMGSSRGYNQDMYGGGRGSHHRNLSGDEDLSHPLIGEHIEVPGDDPSYMPEATQPQMHMRSSMGHGGGMDSMPGHYGGIDAAHHLPTAGSALPMPKVVYNVKFKRTQRSFVMGPRINRDLKIGTYVKVEADRGEDLGIVVGKVPSEKYNLTTRSSFRGGMNEMGIIPPPTGLGATNIADLKRIIRLATHDEVSLLAMKREEEEELLKVCLGKVRQRGLPMNVVDAEYQFDRHKLTFFFEAEGRIDFRELVRDLFSMYKTRIWMQQLDKNNSVAAPIGATPPPPVMIDYGTPIIAPASEFSEFVTYNDGGDATDENTD